ncbi:MAG: HupE/UreJ family protein [Aliidongia sp.]
MIETGIAASIVYMALENIVGADLRHRWIIAGLFGLVHGFGFSSALKDQLQFAGSHLLVSLFSFNLGIEIGQLAVLCLFIPALALLFRGAMSGRMGIIVLSALVAHTAWHWMIERGEVFWQPRGRASPALPSSCWESGPRPCSSPSARPCSCRDGSNGNGRGWFKPRPSRRTGCGPRAVMNLDFDRAITLARLAGEGGEWNEPGEGECAG